MKNVFSLLILITFLGCGNTATEKETASKSSNPTESEKSVSDATTSASVKIFKDDKLVVEYKMAFPKAGIATFKSGEKEFTLGLSNDDNKYNLIATLEKPASGNYSIGKAEGNAGLQLTTDGKGPVPFLTILTEGTFKITLNGETCSGSFIGSQKEPGSENIKITGDFTSVPLLKKTVNY